MRGTVVLQDISGGRGIKRTRGMCEATATCDKDGTVMSGRAMVATGRWEVISVVATVSLKQL